MLKPALMAAVFVLWASASAACRLALALAMDVSSSVSAEEDALQRSGLARALMAPKVQDAFFATDAPVALAVYEWSGRYNQLILQDWVVIESPATLASVAERIARTPRSHSDFPTALGYALGFGATLLARAPLCDAQTLDVSGDGLNNDGFAPRDAYGAFPFDGITVNGLVIRVPHDEGSGDVVDYYTREVILGPAAFVEVADGFEDFQDTMERKLIRELGVRILGRAPPPSGANG